MSGTKSRRKWIESLIKEGYSVIQAKSSHFKILNEIGKCVYVTSLTPSDRRGDLNFVSGLKKCGALKEKFAKNRNNV